MSKSYVSVEQNVCLVCGKAFDAGTLLMDSRMKDSLERNTVTDYGLCPEHKQKFDEGYVALVAADGSKSTLLPNGNMAPGGAYRTGEVMHMKFDVFDRIFNIPGSHHGKREPMMFCEPGVIAKVRAMVEAATKEGE